MILTSFFEYLPESVSHNEKIQKHVLIRRGKVANMTQLARAVFPPGESVEPHAHPDMVELFMVRSGMALFSVSNEQYELKKDDCIVIEPGEIHEVKNNHQDVLILDYFGLQAD